MAITPKNLAKYFEAKLAAEFGPHTLKRFLDEKRPVTVLDVRRVGDFKKERLPGAVNIPLGELEKRYREINKKHPVIAYCYSITCSLAPQAALFLAKKGYRAGELIGGIAEWKSYKMPLEGTPVVAATAVAAITDAVAVSAS